MASASTQSLANIVDHFQGIIQQLEESIQKAEKCAQVPSLFQKLSVKPEYEWKTEEELSEARIKYYTYIEPFVDMILAKMMQSLQDLQRERLYHQQQNNNENKGSFSIQNIDEEV